MAGFWWYRFSLLLFWVGLLLTVAFSVRAALQTRADNTIRLWRDSFREPNRRAVGSGRDYL
jgi:hypothetical protein